MDNPSRNRSNRWWYGGTLWWTEKTMGHHIVLMGTPTRNDHCSIAMLKYQRVFDGFFEGHFQMSEYDSMG